MKNKSKILLSIILAVIAVVAVAVVAITNPNGTQPDTEVSTEQKELLAGNYLTLEEIEKIEELVGNLTNEEIAKLKEEAANGVQDELTLRILLLLEDKIEITLAKDLEILAGMPVKGEKTLTGDATIKMFLGSNNNAMENAILEVERGAALHMNGLVLDGNGVCHAVFVAREATLNYLSGTIQYASSYGIFNQGTLNIEDGTFRQCMAAAVGTHAGSTTHISGGEFKDNYKNHVWTAANSDIEVVGGLFDTSYEHAIYNLGTLKMTGGTICNSNTGTACAVANFGEAYIDGGSEYIEIYNCVTGIFSEEKTLEVSKVYGHDLVKNFLRIKGGQGKVTDCKIINTGTYGVRVAGEVTVEDIYAENLGTHGIYLSPGNITVKNVEVKNAKEYGVVNCGADVTVSNATITGAGTSAFINYDSTFDGTGKKGLLTITDCTATDCKSNLIVRGGTNVKVSNCVFNKTIRTNVHVGEGYAELTNVKLLGASDAECSIVSVRKDAKATITNTEIAYGNRGVSVAGKVTITGGSIHDNKGELAGNALRTENNAEYKLEGVNIYKNHNTSETMAAGAVFMAKNSHGTIIDCKITDNTSIRTVGGIYVEEAELNIRKTIFKKNSTSGLDGKGGAILLEKSKSIIRECTFEENSTNTKYQNAGGAILNKEGSNLTIRDCKFKKNASGRGGAIANAGKLTIQEGTEFISNTCTEGGAGVYNGGNGVVTDTGSTYKKNKLTEAHAGGAIRNDGEKTQYKLVDAVMKDNTSKGNGGAVFSNGLIFVATRCTFDGNSAVQGGAAYINTTSAAKNPVEANGNGFALSATDCKFVNNKSTETKNYTLGGGAIYFTGTGKAILQSKEYESNSKKKYDNAYFKGNHAEVEGGAIVVGGNVHLTVRGYKFAENTSNLNSAAIYVKGKLTDQYGYYYKNTVNNEIGSTAMGGAIQCHLYQSLATASFTNTVFEKNSTSGDGGAIYSIGKAFRVTNCEFIGNKADQGGAIYVNLKNGGFVGENCAFIKNQSTNIGFSGGAVFFIGSEHKAVLENSVESEDKGYDYSKAYFQENDTLGGGGAVCVANTAELKISGYEFKENHAEKGGGALYNCGKVTDNGCSFDSNTSTTNAGAVRNFANNTMKAQYVKNGGTFKNNKAESVAGALRSDSAATMTVSKVEFKGNTAPQGRDIAITPGTGSVVLKDTNTFDGKGNNIYLVTQGKTQGNVTLTGKVEGASVNYSSNNAGINVTGTLDKESDVTIIPASHQDGAKVLKASDSDKLKKAAKIVHVEPDATGAYWGIDNSGCLALTYCAELDGVKYYRIADAIAEAPKGKQTVITLLEPKIGVFSKIEVPKGKNVVIQAAESLEEAVTIRRSGTGTSCIFQVLDGGKLTLRGLILDGKSSGKTGFAGIKVAKGGNLLVDNVTLENIGTTKDHHAILNEGGTVKTATGAKKSVTIQNVTGHAVANINDGKITLTGVAIKGVTGDGRDGIYANSGTVTVTDVTVEDVTRGAICSVGGTIQANDINTNKTSYGVYADKTGIVKLNGATIEGATGNGIRNIGATVQVAEVELKNTGVDKNVNAHAIYNDGGTISTIKNAANAISIDNPTGYGIANINDGKINLVGVSIQNVAGVTRYAAYSNSGDVTLQKVAIKDVTNDEDTVSDKKDAIYVQGGTFTVIDATIENVKRAAVTVTETGMVTLKDVTVDVSEDAEDGAKSAHYGIYCVGAKVSVDNVHISNTGSHSVLNNGGTIDTAKDADMAVTIAHTSGHGIANTGKGTLSLDGVSVQDVMDAGYYAINSDSGSVTVKDVAIKDVAKDGIYVKGGTAVVEGATIENATRAAITATYTTDKETQQRVATGEITLRNVTVQAPQAVGAGTNSAQYGIYCVGGKVYVDNVSISDTSSHAVANTNRGAIHSVEGAEQSLTIANVSGVGVYCEGGTFGTEDVPIKNVTITTTGASSHGIHITKNSDAYMDGVTIENAGKKGIAVQGSYATIKNTVINENQTTNEAGLFVGNLNDYDASDVTVDRVIVSNTTGAGLQHAGGTLTFASNNEDKPCLQIDKPGSAAIFIQGGNITGTGKVNVIPSDCTENKVIVNKTSAVSAETLAAISKLVEVETDTTEPTEDAWFVDSTGKLQTAVAMIGDTYYKDFASALSAVAETETITLIDDVTVTCPVEIDKNVTIKSTKAVEISGTSDTKNMFEVASGNTLTIEGTEDARITVKKTDAKMNVFNTVGTLLLKYVDVSGGAKGIYAEGGTVGTEQTPLSSVKVSDTAGHGIHLKSSSDMYLDDVTVEKPGQKGIAVQGSSGTIKNTVINATQNTSHSGIYVDGSSSVVTIDRVTISNAKGVGLQQGGGTVTIVSNNADMYGLQIDKPGTAAIYITAGTIQVNGTVNYIPSSYVEDTEVVKKGGSITAEVLATISSLVEVALDTEGNTWFVNSAGTLHKAAAVINNVYYTDFASALEAVSATQTITLLDDVTVTCPVQINKDVTIKSTKPVEISGTNESANMFEVASGKTLTVEGTEDARITVKKTDAKMNVFNTVGTLLLKYVDVSGGAKGIYAEGGTVGTEQNPLSSVKVSDTAGHGIHLKSSSNIYLDDVIVEKPGQKGIAVQGSSGTIKNTVINATQNTSHSGIYVDGSSSVVTIDRVTISNAKGVGLQQGGGTVTIASNNADMYGLQIDKPGTVAIYITAGTIHVNGTVNYIPSSYVEDTEVVKKGGTITAEVLEAISSLVEVALDAAGNTWFVNSEGLLKP